MRNIVQKIAALPKNETAVNWFKLVSVTGGAQLIVQLVGLVSGILVIRLLPTQEYGFYTLANTMLGTMIILADGGISSGVMAQGGKVWQDRDKLGVVLATGLELRKKFAIASLLISVPFLFYLLRHHNASWVMSVLIVLSLIPAFLTGLSGTLLQVAPKLNQDIGPLQRNNVILNIGRLVLVLGLLYAFPWAYMAIIAAGISQVWANINLRKISAGYANWKKQSDPLIRKEILSFVKRILPGSIYYCLSGQITIWLISIFGNTTAVAQIGALGRLGMMLSVFTAILSTLVLPRFARLPENRKRLLKTFYLIQLGIICLGAGIIGLVYIFPEEILWILGKDYADLQTELLLSIAGSCMGLVAGTSFGLATSRGWAINPLLSIPLTIVAIIAGIMIIDITSLLGVLKFNLFIYLVEIIMYYVYCTIKINKIKLLPAA